MSKEKTLIFYHVPKTAGSTLSDMLTRKFSVDAYHNMNATVNLQCVDELRHLPEQERRKIRCLYGHMPFGVHEYVPQPSICATLLRDPVERVISEYYHILRDSDHPVHTEVTSKNMSLQDFVRHYVNEGVNPVVSNLQTRCLSGVQWVDLLPGSTTDSSNILGIAKTNLQERFMVIGLTESFDESLILLKQALGWRTKDILYLKRKVGINRPPMDTIDGDTLKLIESYNQLDIELYAWAKRLFEKQINKHGFLFRWNLQIFRFCSKHYVLRRNNNVVYIGPFKNNKVANLLMTLAIGEMQFSYLYNRVCNLMMNKITYWIRFITNGTGKVKAATRKQR